MESGRVKNRTEDNMFGVIKRWFSSLLRNFWNVIKEIFSGAIEIALASLIEIAKEVVSDISLSTLTNEEKRKEAFDRVREYALSKGLDARESIINLAIELAVQALKKGIR